MSNIDKEQIMRLARHIAATRFPEIEDFSTHCLIMAGCVITAAKVHSVRLVLQAGSAYWPRTTPETDDGVEPNRFGYEFEWNETSQARLSSGVLPEMHVWAADPVKMEIVDMTAGDFPAQCKRLIGLGWKAPPPPPCFWGEAHELPDIASYIPDRKATYVAAALLTQALGG